MPAPDRLSSLLAQSALTGIDFVRILDECDQTTLWIYFLVDPESLTSPGKFSETPITAGQIEITSISGGESVPSVPIDSVTNALDTDTSRNVLEITTPYPGDFSRYRLRIDDDRLDRYFNDVEFSFKQACPPDPGFDCEPEPLDCPPDDHVDFPVNYLARDFNSFNKALEAFAAQRYPNWVDGSKADVGVMVQELLAALGDEMSYIQDRYAREAYLRSMTQRRSMRRQSRLVDYIIHDGRLASTLLNLDVNPVGDILIDVGDRVWSQADDGEVVVFEIGTSMEDLGFQGKGHYVVNSTWNGLDPHIFDEDEVCLLEGATHVYVKTHFPAVENAWRVEDYPRYVLLRSTDPLDASVPERRHVVRLTKVLHEEDALLGESITRLEWDEADALPFQMPMTGMKIDCNLVPASAGETISETFTIGPNTEQGVEQAIERQGPLDELTRDRAVTMLYSLTQTEGGGLGWIGDDLRATSPEVRLWEVIQESPLVESQWEFRRSLLDSTQFDDHFTLDDGTWRRIIGFHRPSGEIEFADYASNDGYTVRFGDGEFSKMPADGTKFRVEYRLGPGAKGNLAADTLTLLSDPNDGTVDLPADVIGVSNPLPVIDGQDPEDSEVIRMQVPEAWKAITHRAVRPEDYSEHAERRDWVQRASTCFRWTGSWLSAFTTPDPKGTFVLTDDRRIDLENTLDCVRQAGREIYVRDPRFVPVDLQINICVAPNAYPNQVLEEVQKVLLGTRAPRAVKGFFHPDNFTFGTPLRRSALEAAIQDVDGVLAVGGMSIRARGVEDYRPFDELTFVVADNELIRLENNRNFPERGLLRLVSEVTE